MDNNYSNDQYSEPYNGANWVDLLNTLVIIATGFFFLFNLNNYWVIGGVLTFATTQLVKSILNFVHQLKFNPKSRYIRFIAELFSALAAFTLAILFFTLPATTLATETLLQIGVVSLMAFRALISLGNVFFWGRITTKFHNRLKDMRSQLGLSAGEYIFSLHGLFASLLTFFGFAGITVFAALTFFNPGLLLSAGIMAVSFSALLLVGTIYTLSTNPIGKFSVRLEIAAKTKKEAENTNNRGLRANDISSTLTTSVIINKPKLEEIIKILNQTGESQEKNNIISDIENYILYSTRDSLINKDPAYIDIYIVVANKITNDAQYSDLVSAIRTNQADIRSDNRPKIIGAILKKLGVLNEALTQDSSASFSVAETSIASASSSMSHSSPS